MVKVTVTFSAKANTFVKTYTLGDFEDGAVFPIEVEEAHYKEGTQAIREAKEYGYSVVKIYDLRDRCLGSLVYLGIKNG